MIKTIGWASVAVVLVSWLFAATPTQAAPSQAPTPFAVGGSQTISDNCEQVATVGLLEVAFCETPYGDLFVNSFGFMYPVE